MRRGGSAPVRRRAPPSRDASVASFCATPGMQGARRAMAAGSGPERDALARWAGGGLGGRRRLPGSRAVPAARSWWRSGPWWVAASQPHRVSEQRWPGLLQSLLRPSKATWAAGLVNRPRDRDAGPSAQASTCSESGWLRALGTEAERRCARQVSVLTKPQAHARSNS
nr:uncharacterized protein LOC123859033 [Mirounga angustirostris]